MIISFIYTECQAPGPFKTEPGFKVKDVKLWKTGQSKVFHDGLRPDNSSHVEKSIMEAIGFLPHFEPPAMSPFITNSDFLALEKQWVFCRLPSKMYLFARMSTSGLTHGRRGNPFHMGVLFDGESLSAMLGFWNKAYGVPRVVSPVDLFTWSGWQDPRTAEDLEQSALTAENLPMPAIKAKSRAVDDKSYLQEHRAEIRTALAATEHSFLAANQANFANQNSWDFMKQVSIVSSLLPPTLTWSRHISSAPNNNVYSGKPGWSKAFIHAQAQVVGPARTDSWTHLALVILEKSKFSQLEPILVKLGHSLQWTSTSGTSGLWFLPLAVQLEAAASQEFLPTEILRLAHSLTIANWPKDEVYFGSDSFKGSVLDRVAHFSWLDENERLEFSKRISAIAAKR